MMTVMYNFLNFRRLTLVFLSSVLLLHCASSELWPRHMCAAHTPAAWTHNPTEMPLWRWLLPPHPLLSFSTAAVRYMWLGDHKTLCRLLWDLQCKKQLGTSVARRVFNCGSSLLRDASPQPHAVRRLAVFFFFFFDMHVPSIQALCFMSCSGVSRASVFPRSLSWRPSRRPSEEVGASGPASCVVSGPFRKKRPQSRETTHSCRITARGKDWAM